MRFFAAGFVVAYHYASDAPIPLSELSPVFASGWLATDFFLVLSGYVLARAYGPRIAAGAIGARDFLGKRLLKLWPGYAVVLLVLAVMVQTARLSHASGGHSAGYDWTHFPAQLALVQAWGLGVPPGWNMPAWSLSALVVCYALFPFAWRRLAALPRLTAMTAALGVLFAAAALAAAAGLRLADLPLQIGALRALPLFLLGAAVARLGPVAQAFATPVQRGWLGAAVLACAGAAMIEPTVGALVLIAGGIAVLGPMTPARPWTWAEKAAAVSFPLFVTHFVSGEIYMRLADKVAERLPDTPLIGWGLWAGSFGFALLAAVAFARFVDRPMQVALHDWLERRRARRGLEPAAA